jgi:membrane protease YdiL (CAAX protease family)
MLRGAAAAGNVRAIWTFILLTVWSPTLVALTTKALFGGVPALRVLLHRLFRRLSHPNGYLLALAMPASLVLLAVVFARALHEEAPFLPLAAFLPVIGIQLGTGAVGEELGWRGLLLPGLQSRFSVPVSAVLMGVLWSLWHLPAFFFPYMPQQQVSAPAFLIAVAAFGTFLALVYEKTNGHVLATMIAHFSLNATLALGGARFTSTLWWFLATGFVFLAAWSLTVLRGSPSRVAHRIQS